MVLTGIFILGTIFGAIIYRIYTNTQSINDNVKQAYLKKHISNLEGDAKQKRKKTSNKSKRRYVKKDGSSRSTKKSSKS